MCYDIIKKSNCNKNLKYVWEYNSAWGEWKNKDEVNCISYFGKQEFHLKELSIKMHDSQDPPLVYYKDDKPFYDKIKERNGSLLNPGYYEERFNVIDKKDFYE